MKQELSCTLRVPVFEVGHEVICDHCSVQVHFKSLEHLLQIESTNLFYVFNDRTLTKILSLVIDFDCVHSQSLFLIILRNLNS